jgi:hypothetical protein
VSGPKKPRSRGRQSAPSADAKEQRRLTSAATIHEDSVPYRIDSPPAPSSGEKAGTRGRSEEGSTLRFIDLFCGIGGFRSGCLFILWPIGNRRRDLAGS